MRNSVLCLLAIGSFLHLWGCSLANAQTSLAKIPDAEVILESVTSSEPQQVLGQDVLQIVDTAPIKSILCLIGDGAKRNILMQQDGHGSSTFYALRFPEGRDGLGDLRLTSDGTKAFFAWGLPSFELQDIYDPYVLDLKTRQVHRAFFDKEGRRGISYNEWGFSPDGAWTTYVTGGDANGDTEAFVANDTISIGPRQLWMYHWATQKEKAVATDDTVSGPFAWLGSHTLLFTGVPQDEQQIAAAVKQDQLRLAQARAKKEGKSSVYFDASQYRGTPCIWSYSPEAQQKQILIPNAQAPFVSPDGKWIAFVSGRMLCVVGQDGHSGRRELDQIKETSPIQGRMRLAWSADSRYLYTLGIVSPEQSAEVQGELREWNIATGRFRHITTIVASELDPSSVQMPLMEVASSQKPLTEVQLTHIQQKMDSDRKNLTLFRPQFSLNPVGSTLHEIVVRLRKHVRRAYYNSLTLSSYEDHFYAVDTQTGQVKKIAASINAKSRPVKETVLVTK